MQNQNKGTFLDFLSYDKSKKVFDINEYNTKKNMQLRSQISNIKYDKTEDLYCLLGQYQNNQNDKKILKMIKTDIELNLYNIKGICHKYKEEYSTTNKYTDSFLDHRKYNIKFDIFKLTNKGKNKITKNENDKYSIILLNLNEEEEKYLEKSLINFPRSVLLFTNLEAKLELDSFGKYSFVFKSTYNTKIYMEKNKINESNKSKIEFISSGIYIDYLKSNEFSFIYSINTQKLFSLKDDKLKSTKLESNGYEIHIDLKKLLEIETESKYIEKTTNISKNNIYNFGINLNLCCFVKSIYTINDKRITYVVLENLFDLNSIILEIPKDHEILNNIHINCIELFINFHLFIDDKWNIKLSTKNIISEKSKVILLYFLIDSEKYNNKKINDMLTQNSFSQLLSLITHNKLIRTVQKYFSIVNRIIYINLYYSNEGNQIAYYDGLLQGSDGTSSGFFYLKGKDFSDLKKLKININYYIANKTISNNKITIYPSINDMIQLIIIGKPSMENTKEIEFLIIYENINELKGIKDEKTKRKYLFQFDLFMTKNEFCVINGEFMKKSKLLEEIPMIKVIKYFSLDDYIDLKELNDNKLKDNI